MNNELIKEYNKYRFFGEKPLLCYAPFKNLYLTQSGEVCVCCNTRNHPVGHYPEESILEIWQGEKLKELRDHIRNNDLDFACSLCKNQLFNGDFSNVQSVQYDEYEQNGLQPVTLELELENTCNLECIMCNGLFSSSIRMKREHKPPLPLIYDDKFIDQVSAFLPDIKKIKFLGGEPFLIDIYYKIWERIIRQNPECIMPVQTNATVLNDRIKNILDKGKFYIGISIDSLEKSTYEAIRKGASFEKVMDHILFYVDYARERDLFLNISVCPMKLNILQIPDIVRFCNQNNILLNFNALSHPVYLSLDFCESSKLDLYYRYLSEARMKTDTVISEKNANSYTGLLSYIASRQKIMKDYEKKIMLNTCIYDDENKEKDVVLSQLLKKIKGHVVTAGAIFEIDFYTNKLAEVFNTMPLTEPITRIIKYILKNIEPGNIIKDLEYASVEEIMDIIRPISFEVVFADE